MQRQKEEKDFWEEHENSRLKSNFYKPNSDESSQDESSSVEENLVIKNKKRDSIYKGLGNDDKRIQLESGKRTFTST